MSGDGARGARKVESVWDYPRPPRLERETEPIRIMYGEHIVANSVRALRLLETSHPPTYYLPVDDIATGLLTRSEKTSFCEFKGAAAYWTLANTTRTLDEIAWSYPEPSGAFERLRDHFAFYAVAELDCFVGAERVQPQPGRFYGGWITSWIQGPFKGRPGTEFW